MQHYIKNSQYTIDRDDQTLKILLDANSSWIKTPLKEFGFKCIANKHGSCGDSKCKCLCHNFGNLENSFVKVGVCF